MTNLHVHFTHVYVSVNSQGQHYTIYLSLQFCLFVCLSVGVFVDKHSSTFRIGNGRTSTSFQLQADPEASLFPGQPLRSLAVTPDASLVTVGAASLGPSQLMVHTHAGLQLEDIDASPGESLRSLGEAVAVCEQHLSLVLFRS